MEEIEVGEYIRDKDGLIIKVNEIQEYQEEDDIWYEEKILKGTWKSMIVKHSFNIIDLIEEGDYVNGEKIIEILDNNETYNGEKLVCSIRTNFGEEDIKTIVTKEMMKSIEYRIN